MSDDQQDQNTVQLSILHLQNSVDVGFERVQGQLALVIQRADQTDRRLTGHDEDIEKLDERVDTVERTTPTREDTDKLTGRLGALENTAVTKTDLDTRNAASARWIAIIVAVITLVVSSGVSIGIAVLT